MIKTFRCSKCNQTVYEEAIPGHAQVHLEQSSAGVDALGNRLPSNDRVDFIPIQSQDA